MDWSLVLVLTAAFAVVTWLSRFGSPPSRLRLWVAARLEQVARRLRRHEPAPDPFEVLRLQLRLGILTEQLRALEADPHVYAKAHRLAATRAAYDDLLEEACRMAGVPLDPLRRRSESERLREEVELSSRGWSW